MRSILVMFAAIEIACVAMDRADAAIVGAASFFGSFVVGSLLTRMR